MIRLTMLNSAAGVSLCLYWCGFFVCSVFFTHLSIRVAVWWHTATSEKEREKPKYQLGFIYTVTALSDGVCLYTSSIRAIISKEK